jgi:hypothetical protein
MAKAGQVGTADGSKFVWKKKGNILTRDFSTAAVKKATGGGGKKTTGGGKKATPTRTTTTTRSSSAPDKSVRPPTNPFRKKTGGPLESVRPPTNPFRKKTAGSTTKASGVGNYSKAANAAAPLESVTPRARPTKTTTRTVKSGEPGKRVTKRTVKSGERGNPSTSSAKRHSYDEVPASRTKKATPPTTKTRLASTAKGGPRSSTKTTTAQARADAAAKRADDARKKLEANAKKTRRDAEAKRNVNRRAESLKNNKVKVKKPLTKQQKDAEANRSVNRRKDSLSSATKTASNIPKNIDARFPGIRRFETLAKAAVDQNDQAYESWSNRLAKLKSEYTDWKKGRWKK